MKNAVIAIVGFVAMGLFIALAQRRQREEILRPPENLPNTGQAPTDDDVKRLVETGQKIEAIKLYREIHDVGLKKAKDEVDKMFG